MRRCNVIAMIASGRSSKMCAAHEVVLRRSNCIKIRHTYAVAGVNESNSSAEEGAVVAGTPTVSSIADYTRVW